MAYVVACGTVWRCVLEDSSKLDPGGQYGGLFYKMLAIFIKLYVKTMHGFP